MRVYSSGFVFALCLTSACLGAAVLNHQQPHTSGKHISQNDTSSDAPTSSSSARPNKVKTDKESAAKTQESPSTGGQQQPTRQDRPKRSLQYQSAAAVAAGKDDYEDYYSLYSAGGGPSPAEAAVAAASYHSYLRPPPAPSADSSSLQSPTNHHHNQPQLLPGQSAVADPPPDPVVMASRQWPNTKESENFMHHHHRPLSGPQEVLNAGKSLARSIMKRRPRIGRYDVPQIGELYFNTFYFPCIVRIAKSTLKQNNFKYYSTIYSTVPHKHIKGIYMPSEKKLKSFEADEKAETCYSP